MEETRVSPMDETVHDPGPSRLVETWFPFVEVGRLVAAADGPRTPCMGFIAGSRGDPQPW